MLKFNIGGLRPGHVQPNTGKNYPRRPTSYSYVMILSNRNCNEKKGNSQDLIPVLIKVND